MFLSRAFFKPSSIKRTLHVQAPQYRMYTQLCNNTYKEPHCCNFHPNFNKPCRIDYKNNIIRCRFEVNGCRCQCCPYEIDRIIYYINPALRNKEITC